MNLVEEVKKVIVSNQGILTKWMWLGIYIVGAAISCFILLKIEKKLFRKFFSKYDGINARYTERVIRFTIVFIAAMAVIMSSDLTKDFGTSLFQGTAVLAAIAGFAAKPVLSDMLCGFMLSSTKPFNIGDRIELEDGTAGVVKDITIRHVVLQGIDTLKIIIPNSEINSKRITNLSHQTKIRSIHFRFQVGLCTDVNLAKEVIRTAIGESALTLPRDGGEYSPVYFIGYTNDGLEMGTTVYYEPSHPTEVIRDEVNCRVNEALNRARIEIPYRYTNVIMNPDPQTGAKG